MKIEALQALSFTVSEWAKMAWTLIVLAAFLYDDHHVEVI